MAASLTVDPTQSVMGREKTHHGTKQVFVVTILCQPQGVMPTLREMWQPGP